MVDDPQQKQAIQLAAIQEAQRARSLGDTSPAVDIMLGSGGRTRIGVLAAASMGGLPLTVGYYYAGTPQAQALNQQGEVAFGHRDYAAAVKLYLAAAAADPTWYMPALYSGDAYYQLKDFANAGVWFAKAIAIDPDRETAYRYWGDCLMHAGDSAGARIKFEQAFAAEPVGSAATGLRQWAMMTHLAIVKPLAERPEFITPYGRLTVDPSLTTETGDGHASWLIYQQHRVAHGARTSRQWIMAGSVPNTPQLNFVPTGYVHTLDEEVDAITAMLADVKQKLASGVVTQEKLEPTLKNLLQFQKDNVLEPFILLSFNDAGILHCYPDYRDAHRDQIIAYIDRYLIGPIDASNAPHPFVVIQP